MGHVPVCALRPGPTCKNDSPGGGYLISGLAGIGCETCQADRGEGKKRKKLKELNVHPVLAYQNGTLPMSKAFVPLLWLTTAEDVSGPCKTQLR
jgi:hypothetical protein